MSKMYCYIVKILFLLVSVPLWSQFGPEQIITTEANGCRQVFVADLDGDDLLDVATANRLASTVTWCRNLGDGNFSSPLFIGDVNQTFFITGGDMDGDMDIDIVASAPFEDLIVWFENDGVGNFDMEHIVNDTEVDEPKGLFIADIDGDNDKDVVCAGDISGLLWFENLDGQGNFGPARLIETGATNNRSVVAVDLDGDDFLDIVASSSGNFTVAWYKNLDGLGNFGARQIIAGNASTVVSVYGTDLDGDLDYDILTASSGPNKIAWFENLDGKGNFGSEQVITLEAEFALAVIAADLDNDLDMDVLSASGIDSKVAWYENLDGNGTFSSQKIISTSSETPYDVKFGDLDNDGDIDVISGSQNDDKVAWYENLTILNVDTYITEKVKLVPNPVEDSFRIESIYPISHVKIMGASGKILMQVEEDFDQIPIKNFQSGIYLVEIQIENHQVVKKLVKQ